MNAYELADELEGWSDDWLSSGNKKNVFKKHAKMLRQQADRIAELEKAFISQRVEAYAKSLTNGTKASAIAKVLNAEPKDIWTVCLDCGKRVTGDSIHTCSPKLKTLTDEEINQLWAESHEDGIAIQQGFTTQQHYFARAILRKAQNK